MREYVKRIWQFLLCVVFSVAFALAVIPSAQYAAEPITASAEDPTDSNAENVPLFNESYYFEEGAALLKSADTVRWMAFQFRLKNLDYLHYINGEKDYMETIFTLYRDNANKPIPIYQIGVRSVGTKSGVTNLYFHKPLATDDGVDTLDVSSVKLVQASETTSNCDAVIYPDTTDVEQKTLFDLCSHVLKTDEGSILDYITVYKDFEKAEHLRFIDDTVPYIRIRVKTSSPSANYFVDCNYKYDDYSHTVVTNLNIFGGRTPWSEDVPKYNHQALAQLRSSKRSIFEVLTKMYEKGGETLMQEELGSLYEEGRAILKNYSKQTIQFQYLEQVGDLPFARMITQTIEVPVLTVGEDKQVFHDDLCEALGKKSLSVLGSAWSGTVSTDDDGQYVFRSKYFEAVYLVARTTDGNTTDAGSQSSTNYFLDLNKSYAEYYKGFVDKNVFSKEAYEFFYNDLVKAYSELAGIQPEELHGYFGFVGIPKTNSVNTAWKDIFDIDTSMVGIHRSFETDATLTYDAYQTLLKDYGYRWWERVWNNVANFVEGSSSEAKLYFFCTDAVGSKVGILDNGATDVEDDRGVAEREITEAAEEFLSGLPSLLDEAQAKFEKTMKIILGVVGVVVIVAGGIFLYTTLKKKE